MNDLKKIFKILDTNIKNKFLKYIFVVITGLILEFFSIGLLYQFIDFTINKSENYLIKTIKYFNFEISSDYRLIIFCLVIVFLAFLLKAIYLVYSTFKLNHFIYSINYFLSITLFEKYLYAEYEKIRSLKNSEIYRNILSETPTLVSLISSYLNYIIEILTISVILIVLLLFDPVITFAGITLMSLFLMSYNIFFKKKLNSLGNERQELELGSTSIIYETFNNLREIKLYNLEENFSEKIKHNFLRKTGIISLHNTISQIPRYYFEVVSLLCLIIMIILMSILEYNQNQIISLLGVLAVTIFRVVPSINKLTTNYHNITFFKPALELIVDVFELFKKQTPSLINFNEKIVLKNIFKNYDKDNILKGINVEITKNYSTGIRGISGSGKSTLLDLICGVIKPSSGRRIIDGVDSESPIFCSYISQDSLIFTDTLKKNIILEKKFDKKLFNKAIRDAQLSDFYNSKKGDFLLEENGNNLSGGQKQRIALARAIYQDHNLIILDEPTSSQDNENKQKILIFLRTYKKRKTIIIVSHDIEMFEFCDIKFEIKNQELELI